MSYRIGIAEDEFLLATNLKTLVESLGHHVIGIAETGAIAIRLAEIQKPDLFLMDIKLPEIDGITAARTIAERWKIPTIIISAYSDRSYVEGATEAGVMTYLIKPVSQGDLQAVIDLTMARYRELLALRHEVGDLKQAMAQRKTIERAKGILMDRAHLSESEAFRRLQQLSQRENRPIFEVAQSIITASTLWGEVSDPTETPKPS